MSHVFISYSKKNRDYAYAFAEFLQANGFNIWIDRVGIEYGVDWWDAIVEGLDTCGAFVVIMTPESKASDWVKRETFLALQWKKPLFPLLLNGANWEVFVLTQYVDVSAGAMPDTDFLERLSQHVTPRKKAGENKSKLTPEKQTQQSVPHTRFDIDRAIADFGRAYREHNWSRALEILGRIRASGEDPAPFDPDDFERKVQAAVAEEKRQQEEAEFIAERDRRYGRVLAMAEYADDSTIWAALQKFWEGFPDYDPNAIADQVRPKPVTPKRKITDILPRPFEWCDIPAGRVEIADGHGWFDVPAFQIAKYPVTVAQYEVFIGAGGYQNREWWTEAGWEAREQGWDWDDKSSSWKSTGKPWTQPRSMGDKDYKKFFIPDHPIIGVSWYEAMAFCRWLSEVLGDGVGARGPSPLPTTITLPSEQQWQRAAQGDDGRAYPWGKDFDANRCNSSVKSKSLGTTPVTQGCISSCWQGYRIESREARKDSRCPARKKP
jgi:hypothetical protein